MRLPTQLPVSGWKLWIGLVPVAGLVMATVVGQPPATVRPQPSYQPIRSQMPPTPAPQPRAVDKNGLTDKDKNGLTDKYVDSGPELSLGECIAIALERQPSLKAVQASTAALEIGYRSLSKMGTAATLLSPDLEIRKQQAKRGFMATSAEYQKLHNEIVQDVIRLYYTAVYASQQQQLAEYTVFNLEVFVNAGRELLEKEKDPQLLEGFNKIKLQIMEDGLLQAKKLYVVAKLGRQKALSGLREVMGVDAQSFPFQLKDKELPLMKQNVPLSVERVVELALERRPELVLAAAGVDAFRLEVYAQGKIPFRRVVPTFASGADIHAKEIPPSLRTTFDYRPGGILPEMPTQLVGTKYDRVCRAMAFAQRADAVYEKARNLIIAEAETTFFDFEQAAERLRYAKQQDETSERLANLVDANRDSRAKDQLLFAQVTVAKAKADYLQAVHEYLLALAALERVTAGGIRPEFPGR